MITQKNYELLDVALEYFNKKLFDGKLPDVLITLQRKPKARGFHHFEKFEGRDKKNRVSEIALNPDCFADSSDAEILSTLCHELCHHWQYSFSEPARRGYHDREWANKMVEIGLIPTHNGEPNGKQTGQSMTHLIKDGGAFDIACSAFLLEHGLEWNSVVELKEEKKKKKTRIKYACSNCMSSVMGKKELNLVCGDCMVKMLPEEDENELT